MKIESTGLKEVKLLHYEMHSDNRGTSFPLYNRNELEQYGIDFDYIEERIYNSKMAGTLYGIHFQNNPMAQAKMLYCIEGSGIDYAVDLRKSSPTYLKWTSALLSAENKTQIYIPKGFGHVFLTLEDHTKNVMRIDEPFDPKYTRQIAYNDPQIAITYPISSPILAPHDITAPLLKDSDLNL